MGSGWPLHFLTDKALYTVTHIGTLPLLLSCTSTKKKNFFPNFMFTLNYITTHFMLICFCVCDVFFSFTLFFPKADCHFLLNKNITVFEQVEDCCAFNGVDSGGSFESFQRYLSQTLVYLGIKATITVLLVYIFTPPHIAFHQKKGFIVPLSDVLLYLLQSFSSFILFILYLHSLSSLLHHFLLSLKV